MWEMKGGDTIDPMSDYNRWKRGSSLPLLMLVYYRITMNVRCDVRKVGSYEI